MARLNNTDSEFLSLPAEMNSSSMPASARSPRPHRRLHSHQEQEQLQKQPNGAWSLLSGLLSNTKSSKSNQLSPTSSLSSTSLQSVENESIIDSCKCCGNIIKYPSTVQKYKCVFCKTNFVTSNYDIYTPSHGLRALQNQVPPLSFNSVKKVADECFNSFKQAATETSRATAFEKFKPLEEYLYRAFSNAECLNSSFAISQEFKLSHTHPNVSFKELHETFKLLLSLPVKKPFFVLLTAANTLLHTPPILDSPADLNWLLILLELPTLPYGLHFSRPVPTSTQSASRVPPNIFFFESKEVKAVSYKIIERTVGLLANCDEKCAIYLTNWFARYSDTEFKRKIEFINLFITFHLRLIINKYETGQGSTSNSSFLPLNEGSRSINHQNQQHQQRRSLSDSCANRADINLNNNTCTDGNSSSPEIQFDKFAFESPPPTASSGMSLSQQFLQLSSRIPIWTNNKKRSKKNNKIKLKIAQYGSDWHLKAGSKLLSYFYQALISGKSQVGCHNSMFYNSLIDFINVKQDFDAWQSLTGKKSTTKTELTVDNMIFSVNDYLQSAVSAPLSPAGYSAASKPLFAFCQFPFLLSLAAKIAIIEYEAKRQMEKKAEEAFLHAINKKTIVEVYFKVRVRREYITHDSLRCIKDSAKDLKKSLKVEFIGEPGIDAGGLKKEWFLILTKKLFDPNHGLFYNVKESNFLWFTLNPNTTENLELYYLVGVVLGLAIYNSTILDLKFPPALYKLLLNKSVNFDDYSQIYPETAKNLKKMADYTKSDFAEVFADTNFEITYKNQFDEVHTVELVPNGSAMPVTSINKNKFLKKYADFYLKIGIKDKFTSFKSGFENVINGNAFSLFGAEEIEMILCGSDEGNRKFDLESLRSVTRYNGFGDNTNIGEVSVVKWFWGFFESLTIKQQRRLMLFITGTDRIPATGIVSMNFKITRLGGDSNRLPVAHTCFNELCIYEYESEAKFIDKLTTAMNESEGFGIK